MLYPVTNKNRVAISLNGLWDFDFVDINYNANKKLNNPRQIGVPSSFNELFTTKEDRDFVGKVCYEKTLKLPEINSDLQWKIRIGAAGNRSQVYLDGILINEHNGGFLPIDVSLPIQTPFKQEYRVSIVLDTRLDFQTLPIGEVSNINNRLKQTINYDFSNLIGIHRNVYLYSVPKQSIEDIIIESIFEKNKVYVKYKILTNDAIEKVTIIDPDGYEILTSNLKEDKLLIGNPNLWDIGKGVLYTLKVKTSHDFYEEEFGIREVKIEDNKLLLNGNEVFLKGFGMHEDHITVGKGSISALNIRDFSLLKWINANSFRTSHYPYAEEMYQLADKMGILIINEMPAVGLNFWSSRQVFNKETVNDDSKEVYINQFNELIARDKNHPSVIMYSLANESNTHEEFALDYFEDIFAHARTKTSLPLMIVEWVGAKDNKVAHLADVIGINRYISWYHDFADLELINERLTKDLTEYYEKFNKPLVLTEFGADTISGLHQLPSVAFSEEFQIEFIEEYMKVIRKLDFVIGEHVWNFADFSTKQGLTRINGNKKGVFSRERQPKMIAHWLKKNWE
jgi:beta-glucuronidase